MSLNIPKPDYISAQTWIARTLLNEGRDFGYDNPEKAAECFREAKRLASNDPEDPTKNTARLYLGCMYKSLHNPEAAENSKWLDFAAAQFMEILQHEPCDQYLEHALSNIAEIRKLKTPKRAVEN